MHFVKSQEILSKEGRRDGGPSPFFRKTVFQESSCETF